MMSVMSCVQPGDGVVLQQSQLRPGGRSGRGSDGALEALAAAQKAAVVEHVLGGWVQRPVVALARVARLAGDLHEAVVEAEVVPDRVLPGGEALAVVREAGGDKVTDAAEREPLAGRLEDCHRDECDVRVGRLH